MTHAYCDYHIMTRGIKKIPLDSLIEDEAAS